MQYGNIVISLFISFALESKRSQLGALGVRRAMQTPATGPVQIAGIFARILAMALARSLPFSHKDETYTFRYDEICLRMVIPSNVQSFASRLISIFNMNLAKQQDRDNLPIVARPMLILAGVFTV